MVVNSSVSNRFTSTKSSHKDNGMSSAFLSRCTSNLLNSIWHDTFSHVSLSVFSDTHASVYGNNVSSYDEISRPISSYTSLTTAAANVSQSCTHHHGICQYSTYTPPHFGSFLHNTIFLSLLQISAETIVLCISLSMSILRLKKRLSNTINKF